MEDIDASSSTSPSSTVPTTRPTLTRDPSSTTGSNRPRGILKNTIPTATESGQQNEGVRWDEVNLNYNEVQKEATTRMQITEPKTPYVRYNAETDEVMDLDKIPGFELGQMDGNDLHSQAASSSSLGGQPQQQHYDGDDTDMQEGATSAAGSAGINPSDKEMQYQQQQPATTATSSSSGSGSGSAGGRPGAMRAPSASSRSSSFSGSRRGSESTSRRGSDVSERKMVVVEDHGPGVDAEDEGADEETRQAKKEFKLRRGSHYSGEGEMMKRFRAGILDLDDEDEEGGGGGAEDTNEDESAIDIDDAPIQNGSTHVNGQGSTNSRSGRRIPPVPPLPNGSS